MGVGVGIVVGVGTILGVGVDVRVFTNPPESHVSIEAELRWGLAPMRGVGVTPHAPCPMCHPEPCPGALCNHWPYLVAGAKTWAGFVLVGKGGDLRSPHKAAA